MLGQLPLPAGCIGPQDGWQGLEVGRLLDAGRWVRGVALDSDTTLGETQKDRATTGDWRQVASRTDTGDWRLEADTWTCLGDAEDLAQGGEDVVRNCSALKHVAV